MALLIKSWLGPYEILSAIGAGGMGEVYRARDSKLGRDVAIKVLPEAFARDAERLARFRREAKLLASLNHSNIASIFGVEDSGTTYALVMELAEGPTLAERIGQGPIPVEEAIPIARQIADALEYAHEHGVIHRDLKPANIKISRHDSVKILDFGLAKAVQGEASESNIANSPTISQMATETGVLLGTAAYMSPEQARGKPVDRRADIWAFGCVLYEMLTAKKAFPGDTVTDTLAAIMHAEPDWSLLPKATPAHVRVLLQRCLQKDPKQRLRDIGDARISLDEVLSGSADAAVAGALQVSSQPVHGKGIHALLQRPFMFALGSLLLGAAISGLALLIMKPVPGPLPRSVVRFAIPLPTGTQFGGLYRPAVAISPDGSDLIYVATGGGTQQLYLRTMDNPDSKPIPDTQGATNPFFSPDGKWLGFFAEGKLKKISLSGGSAVTLADIPEALGASWSSQGTIVFGSLAGPLWQVSDAGGTPRPLTQLEKGEASQRFPWFLPGGKALLFESPTGVAVYSLETGERRDLVQGAKYPCYISSGYLLYMQGGTLTAARFDPRRLTVTGAAVLLLEGVSESGSGSAQYSVSSTGSLVYLSGGSATAQSRLVWVSRTGVEQPLAAPARSYRFPRLSPDGRSIALVSDSQIWLFDLNRGNLSRFTASELGPPSWTPDGKRIAYPLGNGGQINVFWQRTDGGGGPEQLTTSSYPAIPMSFSPDGQLLAFTENEPPIGWETWVLQIKDHKMRPFSQVPALKDAPRFSPDGHWLAYMSNESGSLDVYVQPYPGPGAKYQISTQGGSQPVWNPNGKELFYRNGDQMMAVDIRTQPSFVAGKPRQLFARTYMSLSPAIPEFDVSRDGERFLMLKPVEENQNARTQINVVLNWTEGLKRLLPTGNK